MTGGAGWRGYFVYRSTCLRTTWTLRFLLALALLLLVLTKAAWTPAIAASLVCRERMEPSQALVLENFDPDYLVFERAAALYRSGVAPRIVVPVRAAAGSGRPSAIAQGTAELRGGVARLPSMELLPIQELEPITLNAARQLRDFLMKERMTSVTVVSPALRSRRSSLVYSSVLVPAGIAVRCVPVSETDAPRNWTATWHGIQDVGLQFVKLQYYRFWILI